MVNTIAVSKVAVTKIAVTKIAVSYRTFSYDVKAAIQSMLDRSPRLFVIIARTANAF